MCTNWSELESDEDPDPPVRRDADAVTRVETPVPDSATPRPGYLPIGPGLTCWRCGGSNHTRITCTGPYVEFCSRCGRLGTLSRDCDCPGGPKDNQPAARVVQTMERAVQCTMKSTRDVAVQCDLLSTSTRRGLHTRIWAQLLSSRGARAGARRHHQEETGIRSPSPFVEDRRGRETAIRSPVTLIPAEGRHQRGPEARRAETALPRKQDGAPPANK